MSKRREIIDGSRPQHPGWIRWRDRFDRLYSDRIGYMTTPMVVEAFFHLLIGNRTDPSTAHYRPMTDDELGELGIARDELYEGGRS